MVEMIYKNRKNKGQVRIILELFLFALGIMIALFASHFFSNFSEWVNIESLRDQFEATGNLVANGIVKVHNINANASLRLDILSTVNEKSYIIDIAGDKLLLYYLYDPTKRWVQGTFYISANKNINGSVSSGLGEMIIKSYDSTIELTRG